jgi:hypothetical protein
VVPGVLRRRPCGTAPRGRRRCSNRCAGRCRRQRRDGDGESCRHRTGQRQTATSASDAARRGAGDVAGASVVWAGVGGDGVQARVAARWAPRRRRCPRQSAQAHGSQPAWSRVIADVLVVCAADEHRERRGDQPRVSTTCGACRSAPRCRPLPAGRSRPHPARASPRRTTRPRNQSSSSCAFRGRRAPCTGPGRGAAVDKMRGHVIVAG